MRRFLALATASLVIAPLAIAEPPAPGDAQAPANESATVPAAEGSTPAAVLETAPAAEPAPPPPKAAPAASQPPQKRAWTNRLHTWGSVGTTFAFDEVYGSLNAGVGYMLTSSLEPNVEVSYNFGAEPTLWVARPGVTWYVPLPIMHPYVGAYYTHWFVSGAGTTDQDGVGARAGFSVGRVLSFGVTYDRALSCERNCDIWTPSISAGVSL
jgi:hypothetical protein